MDLTDLLEVAYTHLDDDAVDRWATLLRPSLRLVPSDDPDAPVIMSGPGWLTDGQAWPEWDGRAIDFLCRIDCAAVAAVLPSTPLPAEGTLTVWADIHLGFTRPGTPMLGTLDARTRPGWRLRHHPPAESLSAQRHPGPVSEQFPPLDAGMGFEFVSGWTWPPRSYYPQVFADLDGWQDGDGEIDDMDCELAELAAAADPYHYCYHRIGGWADLVDPTVPVALIEAGLVAEGRVQYDAPGAAQARVRAWEEFRLLVQLDTDPDLNWSWASDGKLAFMGRPDDDPSRAWLHASRQ